MNEKSGPDTDALVYSAKSLKDHQTGVLYKFVEASDQKEIVEHDQLAFVQLLPSAFEIEIDVEVFQKLRDRIPVRVRFLEGQYKHK